MTNIITNIVCTIVTCLATNLEYGDNSHELTWPYGYGIHAENLGTHNAIYTPPSVDWGQPKVSPTEKWEIVTVGERTTWSATILGNKWTGSEFRIISATTNRWKLQKEWVKE